MSCEWVIGYVFVSLYYVSLQVNNIRSIFQIWVGDECEMFGLMIGFVMGSVRGCFFDFVKMMKCLILLRKNRNL